MNTTQRVLTATQRKLDGIDSAKHNAQCLELNNNNMEQIKLELKKFIRYCSEKSEKNGISKQVVKLGIIPAYCIGNKVRFRESDVYDSLSSKSNSLKR